MKKLIFITVSLFLTGSLFSQGYQWQAEVEKNDSAAFYKIDLQPTVVAKLNAQFSDIRIKDAEGKNVPYFIKKEPFSVTRRVFKEYEVVQKIKWRNGATVLIVENKDKDTINNIQLQIKNFDVRKHLELAGSDDYKNWYTIKENYMFYSADGSYTTSEVKSLNFPYTDYKYYRIIIYDWFSLPINVIKIGYYDTYQEQGKFKQLNAPVLTRLDSAETKQTYIKVNFEETPYFDKIIIKVEKPTYYYRQAKICLRHIDTKGRVYYEDLKYFTLNSQSDLTNYFSDFNYQEFYLVIENEDNPPLENIEIEAFQLNRYLITHLESKKNYKLVFENEGVFHKPNYDIGHFKNRIPDNIQTLTATNVKTIQYIKKKKVITSTLWMWGAIVVVALLLGYMSYKMITEMEKGK
ncbi:MAG: hypothetical protein COA97_01280 [Flavobacteriales bacterium]|nr:MAG: hypothetical protein COA97_01280 [Flavobacteriales bacterium]